MRGKVNVLFVLQKEKVLYIKKGSQRARKSFAAGAENDFCGRCVYFRRAPKTDENYLHTRRKPSTHPARAVFAPVEIRTEDSHLKNEGDRQKTLFFLYSNGELLTTKHHFIGIKVPLSR